MRVCEYAVQEGQLPRVDEYPAVVLGEQHSTMRSLLSHCSSLPFFSYRRGFADPVPGTSLSTDSGWGCTLRSAQMLLGAALQRRGMRLQAGEALPAEHLSLLRCFEDTCRAPYSLHKLAAASSVGGGRAAGGWVGPSSAAAAIKLLTEQHCVQGMLSLVATTGMVYLDQVRQLLAEDRCSSVLVLCPLRLGLKSLDPSYHDVIRAWLRSHLCVGVIGGSVASSYYFMGYSGDSLLYMDPHIVQLAISMPADDFPIETYRGTPHSISFSSLDVSMTVGFRVQCEEDLEALYRDVRVAAAYSSLFSISAERKAPAPLRASKTKIVEDDFVLLE